MNLFKQQMIFAGTTLVAASALAIGWIVGLADRALVRPPAR